MSNESIRRMVDISQCAEQDGIKPDEYVRRKIQRAIGYHNPLINPEDTFVVLGIDGMENSMFPCKSFTDVDEARSLAKKKIEEEHLYSDGDDVSTTFHIFTMEGVHVPLEYTPENPSQII